MSTATSDLEKKIGQLEAQVRELQDELNYSANSPYLANTVYQLAYEIVLDRDEVVSNEFGRKIDEKKGTMFEVKSQAKRMAQLLGLDADSVRISDINANVQKGDVTSEQFDFESSRGRGEFLMKELTDERRVINGVEIDPKGKRHSYFKRILINYKNPSGPHQKLNFQEIKSEIDRLSPEELVCCFHISHVAGFPETVTIATKKERINEIIGAMEAKNFALKGTEDYYRNAFVMFTSPPEGISKESLFKLFSGIREIVEREDDKG